MIIRSTGLGRTELQGNIKTLEVMEDYLVIGMKTTEPVKWRVRVAVNFRDIIAISKLFLTTWTGWGFIIRQGIKSIIRPFKKNHSINRPQEF